MREPAPGIGSVSPPSWEPWLPARPATWPSSAEQRVAELEADLAHHREFLTRTLKELYAVYSSTGWELVNRYNRFRDHLLPDGSLPRAIYNVLFKIFVKSFRATEILLP